MSTVTSRQTTEPIAVPTGTLRADAVHSSLGFEVRYMGLALFKGAVKDFGASLVDGTLAGAARIASIETKDENLHAHLLSPDFFDAERHPEIAFSGEVVPAGSGVEVNGEITIKGVTRPATLRGTLTGPVGDPYGNVRYGLALETTIDRTEFGLAWNADLPDGTKALANDVTLKAELSLVAAA
jgi:polyisoprenoid-binding protein YceI